MNLKAAELDEIALQVAFDHFSSGVFKRRELMKLVEALVKAQGYWTKSDDVLSQSAGIKSKGLATIDYCISRLKKSRRLKNISRDRWQISKRVLSKLSTEVFTDIKPVYTTRLLYNTNGWRSPAKAAKESPGTHYSKNGFGHEEWLFRNEWVFDGWRYSFIQGVGKSYKKLLAEKKSFDLNLFTISPDRRRYYVASIRDVECLSRQQAKAALSAFKDQGWLASMVNEIDLVEGESKGLKKENQAELVFNVRFRIENLFLYRRDSLIPMDSQIYKYQRYSLYPSLSQEVDQSQASWPRIKRQGRLEVGSIKKVFRKASLPKVYDPDHIKMQKVLTTQLKKEFPGSKILCEENYVDVSVYTKANIHLFEIKTDLEPRKVIRSAIGQLLEYAYYPGHEYDLPTTLTIVGKSKLLNSDRQYLDDLNKKFGLNLKYKQICI